MKSFKRLFQPLAFVLATGLSIEMSAADAPPVRIMPLGDSITLGCCSGTSIEGGYRTRLHTLLTAEGFNVDFVGTQKDANNPALPDVDHEGHGGAHISEIRSGLPVWLKEDKDPDVILLHIGTNDFSTNQSLSSTQDALKGLLADLATARPFAKIIVSSLIVRTDNSATEAQQVAYNQSLPGIVSEQVSLGRQVYFLDMHPVLEPEDLNEGIHPKIAGYEKIADAWLPAISEVITPLGTSNPPAIARVDARQDLTHVTVTFSKPVEDAAATVSNFTLSGGVSVTAAQLDAASKRTVTLTTSTQAVGTRYTLTASGVRDRTPEQNSIATGASRDFTSRTLLDGSFEANGTGWAKGGSSQVYDALPSTPATEGSKLMVFNGVDSPTGGEVSQTVVTIPGQTYKLGFDVGVFSSGSQSLQVSVEGNNTTVLSQTENVTGNSPESTLWTNRTYEFTANSLSTTVTFQDNSSSTQNADLLLDDVRLNLGLTPTLTVNSTPAAGVAITVAPNDLSANGNGTTNFTRVYDENTLVNLTAPATSGSKFFDRWKKDSANHSVSAATSVTMGADHTMTADYRILKNGSFESGTPAISGTVTDWTTSGNFFTYTSDGTYNANDFIRFLVFNGGDSTPNGAISQTFTTTPGQAYQVNFDLGTYALNTNLQEINVAITGISSPVSQTDSVARTSGDPNLKWVAKTASFVASGTSATITFTDVTTVGNGNSADLYLDNVKVSEALANTAPVAVNDSYTTSINVPLTVAASGVLANDTDAQSNLLTAVVVVNPTHGSVTLNTNGGFTYTPTTGYTGSDSFTYKANDGSLDSNAATVSLTISAVASGTLTNGSFEQGTPANLGPATGWNFSANYPTSGAPLCYVPDGSYPATVPDGIRLLIFNAGPNDYTGSVSQSFATTPGQTYSLNLNAGVFSSDQTTGEVQKLQITVNGGSVSVPTTLLSHEEPLSSVSGVAILGAFSYSFTADSATTTLILSDAGNAYASSLSDLLVDHVRVAIASANTAPVAVNDSYSTNQNTALNTSAPGVLTNDTDAQSNSLTAIQVSGPSHGTLSLATNGSFTYTPTNGYTGPDSFTYKANDGNLDSNTATVSITVTAPAVELLANGGFESGAIIVDSEAPGNAGSVTALDNWGGSGARFGFIQIPAYPAPEGQRILVFNGGYNGGSNTFDGFVTQSFATTPGQSYSISMDVGIYAGGDNNKQQRLEVKLDGTGNLLTQPVIRTSTTVSSIAQWAPANFTFIANSATTTLTLSDTGTGFASAGSDLLVDHVQITPVQNARTLTVNSSPASGFAVTVSPTDLGGSSNGTTNFTRTYANNTAVTLTAPEISGANAFQKWQKNGVDLTTSLAANVTMDANYTLTAVYVINNAPFAVADSYTTSEDTPKIVAAPGVLANDTDPNSASITAVLDVGPTHGTLTLGLDGGFTYTPTLNYSGPDSFTYHANNGSLDSPDATVSLTVTPVNDPPAAVAQSVQTNEDTALPITLTGTDADADTLTYVVGTASHGALTGTAPNLTYTPAANYFGPDSFTFTVNDGTGASAPATITIDVVSVEDIPVADAQSVSLTAATSKAIVLTGSDGDVGQVLTFAVATGPAHGTLSGTAPNLTYTPVQTYTGSDSFTFTASDGTNTSPPATVSITVNGILKNGSFELHTGIIPDFWTTSGNFSDTNSPPLAKDGSYYIAFNDGNRPPNAVISQSFQTAPGQPYQVLFDLGRNGSGTQVLNVTLTGSTQISTADLTVGALTGNWETAGSRVISFIANSASTTLRFEDKSATTTNVDMLLDNVRVNPRQTRTLTVASSPDPGVNVTVSPADISGSGNGVSGFTRVYLDGAVVNLTAPAAIAATNFQKWQKNGTDLTTNVATPVTMNADYTLTAVYIPNAPPVATADSYTTNEDVALVVPSATGVLANDTDPESVAMTAIVDVGPTHGTLVLNATNGGFTYTPAANYFGPDSFTYHASDGVVSSESTTVSLTVTAVNDAPVGVADSYTTNEDTPLVVTEPGVLTNDTDVESNLLTALVDVTPIHGTLSLNTDGSFTYTPAADYNGADSFTYHANDGAADSAGTTVSLTVNSVNDAPVAVAQSVNVDEDSSVAITLAGTDVEGSSLTYLVGAPAHGILSGTAPNLTYTPAADYNGSDSFSFTVSDGLLTSASAAVSITVAPVNDAPVATAQSVSVNEDGSVSITLSGTDVENSPLTFTAVSPSHGSLTGTAPNLTYTPVANYNGSDSFTFTANDGTVESAPATVLITVTPVNDAPVATAQSVNVNEDGSVEITLAGTDLDGNTLSFTAGSPSHGNLTGTAPNLTYAPAANYNGPDSFEFVANDGVVDSAPAVISITVAPVNDAPVATAQSVNVNEDGSVSITLTGTDEENSSLTFTAGTPANGTLTGTAPNLTYTPAANYNGSDSFSFTANDGTVDSAPAVVSITIAPMNDAPVATAHSVSVNEDGTVAITLAGTDLDGDTLNFTAGSPAHGILSGTAPNLTYTPAANYNGSDSFEFVANDGLVDSVPVAVSITVDPVNDAPVAVAQTLNVNEDGTLAITLSGTDVESSPLSYTVGTPAHGTLSGTVPDLTYTPAANYNGSDSFSFTVNDGTVDSASAVVSITIAPVNDAPVAAAQSVNVNEDGSVGITLSASDVDEDGVTYSVGTPAHGILSGTAPNLTYTPAANYNGSDSFSFTVNDGLLTSAAATVSITVAPVNDAPVAAADSYSTNEDTALIVDATGVLVNDSDVETDPLTAMIDALPSHGTLALNPDGSFTYEPVANYQGPDSFTYHANDVSANSGIATVSITVNPVNDAPVAVAQTLNVNEDGTLSITLSGTDVESSPLSYTVGTPAHGTLSGTAPDLTYTPAENYNGPDSFSFTVNDGTVDSASALVSITVAPVNDTPVAVAQSVNLNEDGSVAVTLAGTDVEGSSLTYTVGTPAHGTLSGTAPDLTYTPAANYNGSDSFSFTVNDGTVDSASALVSITVAPVNDAPVAVAQLVNVNEDGSVSITLTGTDVDDDSLTFAAGAATHGTLSGTAPNLTYTPSANYHGPDSFSFTANDGLLTSAPAAVSITVVSVNDAPVTVAQSVNVSEDGSVGVTLSASDVDGDTLSYTVGTPAHGTLSGIAPDLTYTPAANYNGSDSFSFTVNDGTVDSASALVSITVAPVNDAPVAVAQTLNVNEDGTLSITLSGTDVESSPLSYTVGTPAHGTLSGTAPNLTYTPASNYNGSDSFSFTVNDGTVDSASALVSITIAPVNDSPVAVTQSVSVNEDGSVAVTLAGTDEESSSLTYTVGTPAHGTLSGTAPNLTYTPAADYNGSDSFSFTVNDGTVDSASALVSITVVPVNDAPVAAAQTLNANEDGTLSITLSGTDVESSLLTYTVGTPAHGTLSGTAPSLTYTPAANYNGSDSFSFTVNDGTVDSAPALVSITVAPVNDAPVAVAQSVNVNEDGSVAITLVGTDVESSSLTYTVGTPAHGTLSGTAPNLTYAPAANYFGSDSFSFTVNDGTVDSVSALVSITVAPVNDAPVANSQSVSLDEDTTAAITLAGSDQEGTSLTFSVTVGPEHGTLSGMAPNLTYTPAPNYNGTDSFSFVANDGTVNSAPAEVSITIAPVPDNSFGEWLASYGLGGGPGNDPDHDSISNAVEYVIGGNPANRADLNLLPTISLVTSDPDQNSVSNDYLLYTYRRTDLSKADPNTIIQVQWSTALAGGWANAAGTPGVVTIEENDAAASGVDLVKVYIPRSLAANGKLFARLYVSIDYTSLNVAPVTANQSVSLNEDGSLPITLAATDANGDPLSVTVTGNPQHGTLSGPVPGLGGSSPTLTYTPAPNYYGPDSFTYKVNDGTVDSAPATVSITVNPQEEFAQWMNTFSLNAGPTVDSDNDSIGNVVEYVIGGNPAGRADANLLPTVSLVTADPDGNTVNSDYLLFTYRRTDLASTDPSMTIRVTWGTSLAGTWTNATGTPGVVTLVTDNGAGPSTDTVSVYIPRSLAVSGKLFARLQAALATP